MKLYPYGFIILAAFCIPALTNAMDIGFGGGKSDGWTFSLGSEFPGAEGNFAVMPGEGPEGSGAGRLEGDFRHGGAYVAISRQLKTPVTFHEIRILLRNAGGYQKLMVRLVDETGQVHQTAIPLQPDRDSWQTVSLFPAPGAHSWGGAKDRLWHGKLWGISLMGEGRALPHSQPNGQLFFNAIDIRTGENADKSGKSGVRTGDLKQVLAIDPGLPGWRFDNGGEFPGASGTMQYDNGVIRLNAEFTGKSSYVSISRAVDCSDFDELRFQLKGPVATVGVRFLDAGAQCHLHITALKHDPENWTEVTVPVGKDAKAHWGGVNDGVVRFPLKRIDILAFRRNPKETSSIQVEIKDVTLCRSADSAESK